MVNVSVIVSKKNNRFLEDFDIAENVFDASGEYIYFKNTNLKFDRDALEFDGDLCIFNPKEDFEKRAKHFALAFDDFFEGIFRMDFDFCLNLIQKLKWDVMIKKEKLISLYEPKEYGHISEAIDNFNKIFKEFIDNKFIMQYQEWLYNVKLEELIKVYAKSPTQEAYDLLKEDFTQMVVHWRFAEFSADTTLLNKMFFDGVVYTKSFEELNEIIPDYYMGIEMNDLNDDIDFIRYQNNRLRKEIKRLSKINSDVLNSKSWRYTEPIRTVKHKLK